MFKKRNQFMKKVILSLWLICGLVPLFAQRTVLSENLNQFKNKGSNWIIAGDVSANPFIDYDIQTSSGTGVLVNDHEHGTYGDKYELVSEFKHGDLDISFDFMMAKNSNSGVYMQGRYEIQLLDSWGKKNPIHGDCGGIYHRWDESKPEGKKGYDGHAPRVNASKAPGLWQHMEISFRAPRFDSKGNKTSNATVLAITLNGMLLHENVELSGVTRGAYGSGEVPMGPLRFQGDHGPLALKNIVINNFDKPSASLNNLSYGVSYISYDPAADPDNLPLDETGQMADLTWEFMNRPNNYSYNIKGDFNAPADGKYEFTVFSSANNFLKVDGEIVLANKYTGPNDARNGSVELKAGKHSIELYNAKYDAWMNPTLGLYVAGPGFRKTALHSQGSMLGNKPTDPILVDAKTNTNIRSFMDFEKDGKKKRIVHAISVGTPENLHFTYDLDRGALLQIWRGDFLDATPMWDSRGDGSSKPRGSITLFDNDLTLNTSLTSWSIDTSSTGFRPKGYMMDEENRPTFMYEIYGSKVSDKIIVKDSKVFERTITLDGPRPELAIKLSDAKNIEKIQDGLYAVNNKDYFIKLDANESIHLVDSGDNKQLIVLAKKQLTYDILF
ncbi:MAG: hypothetical protein ACI8UX_001939 [Psychromonas sp.]|jgi:hypothetical protein